MEYMARSEVNNQLYDDLGERWYTAYDDPVALLRAESKIKTPWIVSRIRKIFPAECTVLDIGCGGGFLSNALSANGMTVTGVDLSQESLDVARRYDSTGKVTYLTADAYKLPFPDQSFDVVTAMDFLEHVDRPEAVVKEISRVLKPRGVFFFHTFNRNLLSYFVIIKLVEWLVKNTPKNLHVLHLFIKPRELDRYCMSAGMKSLEWTGIRPSFRTLTLQSLLSGIVPKALEFKLTKSLLLSYMGMARKND